MERWFGFWYAPAPAARLALLRMAVGGFALSYLCIRTPHLLGLSAFHAGEFAPVGVVRVLSTPLAPALLYAGVLASLLTGVMFVLGIGFKVVGPAFAALLWWLTSYRSSGGMICQTDNLLTLHVALLALSPAADVLSWDARRAEQAAAARPEHGRYGWVIRAMAVVTACTYVVAGCAKLRLAGSGWFGGELLRAQIAFDNLRKIELGSGYSELGVWFVRHPAVFAPLAVATLLLELGAPAALLGRRVALIWCCAAWSFHVGIALLMNIGFPYPLSFLAYLPSFRIERLLELGPLRRLMLKHPTWGVN